MLKLLRFTLLSFGLFLTVQCGGDKPTEPAGDKTPPTVLSTTPVNNAADIPVSTTITAAFSEKTLSSSLTTASFTVDNGVNGTISQTDSTATFIPSGNLQYSTTYTVTLTTAIKDRAENSLAADFNFSFTTEADPSTIPPTVITTYPPDNNTITNISDSIVVTFSKDMDSSSINDTTFIINNSVTGIISYNNSNRTAIFKPDTDLTYDTDYQVTLTTAISDIDSLFLQQNYIFNFSTPTLTPTADFVTFNDTLIVGDSTDFLITTTHPIGVDSVQFYIDGVRIDVDNNPGPEFSVTWDASGQTIASIHELSAIAYDSAGNIGYSDSLILFYKWMEVVNDGFDEFTQFNSPQNLLKIYTRSTDSTFDLRFNYFDPIQYNVYSDTTINIATFFDTDHNRNTGKDTLEDLSSNINGIGADYRLLYGIYLTEDIALAKHNPSIDPPWSPIHDSGQFNYVDYFVDSNFVDISIFWDSIGSPYSIDVVSINMIAQSLTGTIVLLDWAPDTSFYTIYRNSYYVGTPVNYPKLSKPNSQLLISPSTAKHPNPFD